MKMTKNFPSFKGFHCSTLPPRARISMIFLRERKIHFPTNGTMESIQGESHTESTVDKECLHPYYISYLVGLDFRPMVHDRL